MKNMSQAFCSGDTLFLYSVVQQAWFYSQLVLNFFPKNQGFFSHKIVLTKKRVHLKCFCYNENKIRKNQKNLRNAKFLDRVDPGLPGKTLGTEVFQCDPIILTIKLIDLFDLGICASDNM